MATVFDVAAYILENTGSISTMKLQKLCYYSQAWSLVWDDKPIFREEIQAWVNGPVIPDLFHEFQGEYMVDSCKKGNSSRLTQDEKETIDAVIEFYGKYSGAELSELTHSEIPWKEARKGLAEMEYGQNVIDLAVMSDFYTRLASDE